VNIAAAIAEEHSKAHASKIAAYAVSKPAGFKELMKCFFSSDNRIAQRAAWSASLAVQQKPALIGPYLETLMELLQRKEVHPGTIRNSLRILQYVTIPEAFHGVLLSACINFTAAPETPVAIKAFSLNLLTKLAVHYPEIIPEVKLLIEDRLHVETAAFASSARRFLRKHDKPGRTIN
jgi:hypothetical protein